MSTWRARDGEYRAGTHRIMAGCEAGVAGCGWGGWGLSSACDSVRRRTLRRPAAGRASRGAGRSPAASSASSSSAKPTDFCAALVEELAAGVALGAGAVL
eukprot:scaffold2907_cov57-Phaeocystis_antarctica.AAC.1